MQLVVSVTEGVYVLNQEDIICLEASSNYTRLCLTGSRYIFSARTLKHYESELPSQFFWRVRSSCLINTKHICNVNPSGEISLSQNINVRISKRKKMLIKEFLKRDSLIRQQ
jgi:two-component system LytT family response regulator